jgi:hypothetical protein
MNGDTQEPAIINNKPRKRCRAWRCTRKKVHGDFCDRHIQLSGQILHRARGLTQRWIMLGINLDLRERETMAQHITAFAYTEAAGLIGDPTVKGKGL